MRINDGGVGDGGVARIPLEYGILPFLDTVYWSSFLCGLWGKGVMVDDAVAPPARMSQPRPSFGPVPSFRNVFGDAIHTEFFPFSVGPYYATYPEDGVAGNYEFTWDE
nr:hypothetical protein [Tanacetum cinerariifolium]